MFGTDDPNKYQIIFVQKIKQDGDAKMIVHTNSKPYCNHNICQKSDRSPTPLGGVCCSAERLPEGRNPSLWADARRGREDGRGGGWNYHATLAPAPSAR